MALSTQCPLLKELNIPCIPRIFTSQSAAKCAPALSCIHSICTYSLRHFHVDPDENTLYYTITIPYLTELRVLKAMESNDHVLFPLFSQYCLKLESLKIYKISSSTPAQLLQLVKNCRYLHTIKLYNDTFNTDDVLIELTKHCFNLQKLILIFDNEIALTDASLLALSENCVNLCELNIDSNYRNGNVINMVSEVTVALCAPALSCIHTIVTPTVDDITNFMITVPYLTELLELYADGPNDHILLPLLSQYCKKLESVYIRCSSYATPTVLLQLTKNCPYLHSIHTYNDDFYSDELVIGLAKRCPNLQKLVLSTPTEMNTITDRSLLALSKHCPYLQELVLNQCIHLSETAVLQFIQQCKYLYKLVLPDTVVSEDTVLTLPVSIPNDNDEMMLFL